MTKERPILFSGGMVRAILDGRKTQTRRVAKEFDGLDVDKVLARFPNQRGCPYGEPGGRLWVRETWAQPVALDPGPTVYRADYPSCVPPGFENIPPAEAITWKPSIHMPRALCRLVLEITGVRVERLNDCSEADALAEGLKPAPGGWWSGAEGQAAPTPQAAYALLWDSISGAGAWDANPWMWVVEFRRDLSTIIPKR